MHSSTVIVQEVCGAFNPDKNRHNRNFRAPLANSKPLSTGAGAARATMSSGVPLGSEFQLEDVSTDQNSLGETSGRQASKAQQSASAPTARLSPDVEEHVRLMQAEKDAAIALCDARKAEFQKKLAEMSAEYGAQFDRCAASPLRLRCTPWPACVGATSFLVTF